MNRFFFTFALCVLSSFAWCQQQHLDSITRKFSRFRERTFQEKIFVHVDQDFYLTGENMWFRIYNVDATLHHPVSLSKVAYVEILDKNNKAVVQTKVSLRTKGGKGSVYIPATLGSGNYVFRVYTQWMKNFSPEFYFHKSVTIVNPFIKPEPETNKTVAAKPSIEFFPEGGNLVGGLRSKVAFKINNAGDKTLRGFILNSSRDTVAAIAPLKFGLGHFYLTPGADSSYSAVLLDETRNVVANQALPKIFKEGYVMEVADSGNFFLKVRVRNKQVAANSLRYVYLLVHSRNVMIHAETKPLYPSEAMFLIDKKKLPAGISHFTIFDEERNPLCERLYFSKPSAKLDLAVNSTQNEFTTRRKVTVDVSSMFMGRSSTANISLAVYKNDSITNSKPQDFHSYLYLTSDLKGDISDPDYYFSDDKDVKEATDNLMLTHGWRRFDWAQAFKKKSNFKYIHEYRSHLVTAKVTKQDGSPVQGVLTYLSSPAKIVNLYTARSNEDGATHFEVKDFWGSRHLVLQANTSLIDSTYKLSINSPFSTDFANVKIAPYRLDEQAEETLRTRSLAMQVQDIYYRDESERVSVSKQDSTAFYGTADQTYNLDDYTRFPVLEEVMREYVPGVLVRKRKDGFHFMVIDKVNNGMLPGDPLVILDGVPVFDVDKIMAFDPLRIKKLEVVMRNYYVGPLKIPGIVSYSTYSGDLNGFTLDARSVVLDYEGLQLQREFYSPKYDNQKQRANRMPDQRTLLFWAPDLTTGLDGKKTIEFYTSDVTGNYHLVVQGINDDGIAGTGVYDFSVRRNDF